MLVRSANSPDRNRAVARPRLRGLVALIGALALGLFGALGSPTAAAAYDEGTIHSLVNQSRAASSLGPLTLNSSLSQVAANWANQLAANGVLSHNPQYSSQIPGGWSKAAENVAQGYSSGAAVHAGWMDSPGHRANVLGDFTDIGIAHVSAGGDTWSVEVFAKYGGSAPAPKSEPAPPSAAAPAPAPAPPAPAPKAEKPEAEPDPAAAPDPDAEREALPGTGPTPEPTASPTPSASADAPSLRTLSPVASRSDGSISGAAGQLDGAATDFTTKLVLGIAFLGSLAIAVAGWLRFAGRQ